MTIEEPGETFLIGLDLVAIQRLVAREFMINEARTQVAALALGVAVDSLIISRMIEVARRDADADELEKVDLLGEVELGLRETWQAGGTDE